MRTGLDHLPQHKRKQIEAIAALVQASAPVEMIVLFGSYARGDWVEDLAQGYFSDFDVMVVVDIPALAEDDAHWAKVQATARRIAGRVPVTLAVHDVKQLNHEIRTGQYFFSDVVNEGVLLYDSHRFTLAKPKAQTPEERLEIGHHNFNYWFQSASGFFRGATYYAAQGMGAHSAFLLHQAAERYFHAALLVYTGYKPKTHDIQTLANQTAPLHPELEGALPRTAPEDERLFSLLKRAYIEARYSKSYHVTSGELSALRHTVLDLAARVRHACAEKLQSISGAQSLGELPLPPAIDESVGLSELPPLDDVEAVKTWRAALVRMSYEQGEAQGALEERARAIVDVLRRRGIQLEDDQAAQIQACREEATLHRWWDLAWSIESANELLAS
jgi:HEPN domain-containing protein/predicted nucleotidyltransferase